MNEFQFKVHQSLERVELPHVTISRGVLRGSVSGFSILYTHYVVYNLRTFEYIGISTETIM